MPKLPLDGFPGKLERMTMVATAPCPSLEEIAAFLDGALQGEDRDRVVQHLNECPDCYELFVETAEVLDECRQAQAALPVAAFVSPLPAPTRGDAKILQHRKREPGGFQRIGLPLAAALMAMIGGYLTYGAWINRQPAADKVILNLTPAEVASLARKKEEILPSVSRGPNDPAKEFELGSALVSYELFRAAGDSETLDGNVRPGVVKALAGLDDAGYPLPDTCRPLLPKEGEPAAPGLSAEQRQVQLAACIPDLRLQREISEVPDFLLGEWAQSARVALLADRLSFFTADGRRVPAWRLRQAGSFWQWVTRREEFPLPPEVAPLLESLRDLVGDGVTPEEKTQVGETLEELTDTYAAFAEGE